MNLETQEMMNLTSIKNIVDFDICGDEIIALSECSKNRQYIQYFNLLNPKK